MPTELNVEHQFSVATTGLSLAASTAIFACLSFVFVAVRLYSLPRKWMFWLAWPVVTSAPVVLVPLHVLVNEHRMYLPMVAFGAFLSALFVRLFSRDRRAAVITATCLLIVYSLLVIERNVVWQNSKSLWTDALRKAPFMPRPHIFVGDVHKEEGRHESALKEYRTAAAVSPQLLSNLDRVVIYNNMGATLLAMGRFNEAIEHYQKALSVDPTYEKALASLEGLLAVSTDARIARAEELPRKRAEASRTGRGLPKLLRASNLPLKFRARRRHGSPWAFVMKGCRDGKRLLMPIMPSPFPVNTTPAIRRRQPRSCTRFASS